MKNRIERWEILKDIKFGTKIKVYKYFNNRIRLLIVVDMETTLLDSYQRITININIKPNDINPHIQAIYHSKNRSLLMPTI